MQHRLICIVHVLAVFSLLLASALNAQVLDPGIASADATASVIVLKPAEIINVNGTPLSFGTIVSSAAGTVTVTPENTRIATGVTIVPSSSFTASAFQVKGSPSYAFTITLPASTTLRNGPHSMLVDDFRSLPANLGLLDETGTAFFNVGATLHVNANQPVGRYKGIFPVTVAYN